MDNSALVIGVHVAFMRVTWAIVLSSSTNLARKKF